MENVDTDVRMKRVKLLHYFPIFNSGCSFGLHKQTDDSRARRA